MTDRRPDTESSQNDDVIITGQFRTTSGDYFAVLLSEWLPRYGWTLFIPILATAGFGCLRHDERWLLVALMLVFIVAPMVMSFLYTYYMLAPEARRAVLCKRVEIAAGRYLKLVYEQPDKDESGECETQTQTHDGNSTQKRAEDNDAYAPLPPAEIIEWSDVVRIRRTSRFMVYFLRGERMQFILIPHSALSVSRQPRCE